MCFVFWQVRLFELGAFSCRLLDGHTETVLALDVAPDGCVDEMKRQFFFFSFLLLDPIILLRFAAILACL